MLKQKARGSRRRWPRETSELGNNAVELLTPARHVADISAACLRGSGAAPSTSQVRWVNKPPDKLDQAKKLSLMEAE